MPVPTLISQLSTTASLNSPDGAVDVPSSIDDYLRAHAAFIAQLYASTAQSVDIQNQTVTAFTTGGTATAFTLTPTPAIAANTTNQRFAVKFNAAAGLNPTLSISGNTALNLKYRDSTGTKQAITATQVPANWISDVVNDGTDYVVLDVALAPGVTTNSSAAAGYVGEYIESVAGPVNAPTSSQYGDITSISLTAGDWDISAIILSALNTGTSVLSSVGGIGTAAGNNNGGLVPGDTSAGSSPPGTDYSSTITIPPKRISIASTTIYYLKMRSVYSSGTPQFSGRISARRVR